MAGQFPHSSMRGRVVLDRIHALATRQQQEHDAADSINAVPDTGRLGPLQWVPINRPVCPVRPVVMVCVVPVPSLPVAAPAVVVELLQQFLGLHVVGVGGHHGRFPRGRPGPRGSFAPRGSVG